MNVPQGKLQRVVIVLVLTAIVNGCSSSPKTSTVRGTVTFEGKNVTGGTIGFISEDGRPCQADIMADGSYRVDNVPVGDCIVVINPPPQDDSARHKAIKDPNYVPPPTPPPPFPLRYSDMTTSGLKFTVKAGENTYIAEMKR